MHPRQIRDTSRPLVPSWEYFISSWSILEIKEDYQPRALSGAAGSCEHVGNYGLFLLRLLASSGLGAAGCAARGSWLVVFLDLQGHGSLNPF